MSDIQRPTEHLKRDVSGQGGALFATLVHLWPYIWPSDRARPQDAGRVRDACCCFAAKLATIAVPFTFKWATDALTGERAAARCAPVTGSLWTLARAGRC